MLQSTRDCGINNIMLWKHLDDRFWFKEKKGGKNVWFEKKIQKNASDTMIKNFIDRITKKSTKDVKEELEKSTPIEECHYSRLWPNVCNFISKVQSQLKRLNEEAETTDSEHSPSDSESIEQDEKKTERTIVKKPARTSKKKKFS